MPRMEIARMESLLPRAAEVAESVRADCWGLVKQTFAETTGSRPGQTLTMQVSNEISEGRYAWVQPDTQSALKNVSKLALANTLRVTSESRQPLGTAFFINQSRRAATNWHVVNDLPVVGLQSLTDSSPVAYRVADRFPERDLALLEPVHRPGHDLPKPQLIPRLSPQLDLDEKILGFGFPRGDIAFSPGYFDGRVRHAEYDGIRHENIYEARMEIDRGNSGTLVYDLHGQAIGYASAVWRSPVEASAVTPVVMFEAVVKPDGLPKRRPESLAYIVPIDRLLKFV
jgi:S1-C subfamily serine protease